MATKGHWPAGKRRNASDRWPSILRRLRKLFAERWRRGWCTQGALASELGVDRKTVWKWMNGENFPAAHYLAKIDGFIQMRMKKR